MTSPSVRTMKAQLRRNMKSVLQSLSPEHIEIGSLECFDKVVQLEEYKRASHICCYLSMPNEMQTSNFLRKAFMDGKNVYIPKVLGPDSDQMIAVKLLSYETIEAFPKSKWLIPEPQEDYIIANPDVSSSGIIDLVIVPGVAFDANCNRLGHGKGYYDTFLAKLNRVAAESDSIEGRIRPPCTVAAVFDHQIVDDVPVTDTDVRLNIVITPSRVFRSLLLKKKEEEHDAPAIA